MMFHRLQRNEKKRGILWRLIHPDKSYPGKEPEDDTHLWDTQPCIPETYPFRAAFSSQRNAGQGGLEFPQRTQHLAVSSLSLKLAACLPSPDHARNWMDLLARGVKISSVPAGVIN